MGLPRLGRPLRLVQPASQDVPDEVDEETRRLRREIWKETTAEVFGLPKCRVKTLAEATLQEIFAELARRLSKR